MLRVTLLAAVVVPVLARGGYLPASRVLFAFLAAVALIAAVTVDPAAARRIASSPPVLILIALAAFGALSTTWTIVPAQETLRWAAVAGGYAAVVVAAGVEVTYSRSPRLIAAALAVLAVCAGLIGLFGAATFSEPFADRIAGTWRAGGPLEYPPALGLLEVSALPILLVGMTRPTRAWAGVAAAGGAAVAGASLGLTASRTQLFLGACVLGLAITWPQLTVRAPRRLVVASAALVGGAAAAAIVVCDPEASARSTASGVRVAGLLAIVLVAAAAWAVVSRNASSERAAPAPRAHTVTAAIGALLIAVPAGLVVLPSGGGPGSDFTHGRIEHWDAALRAAADQPLGGAGADSFFAASEEYQHSGRTRFAHNMPLELLVELGPMGLLLTLALYGGAARAMWRARTTWAGWLLGPAIVAFLAANLIDWPWHLAGAGAVWAAALGGVIGEGWSNHLSGA